MTERETNTDVDLVTELVHRVVEVDMDIAELWRLISRADELATWIADEVDVEITPGAEGRMVDDGTTYEVQVEDVVEGEYVSWRWRPEGDEGTGSSVTVRIEPWPGGGRLTITETRPAELTATASIARSTTSTAQSITRWEVRSTLAALRGAQCLVA